jgi:hypothetical protein
MSSPSIQRIEVIALVFEESPFLKMSMVDSSFLRIWFRASSEARSVLVEVMVPVDKEGSESELDC